MLNRTRTGKVTEYRQGDYYLYLIDWGQQRIELEILKSEDQKVWSSRDPSKIEFAKKKLEALSVSSTESYPSVGQTPPRLEDKPPQNDDRETRHGKATEMVRGDYFLTILEFEFGDPVIDIHRVRNTPIFYDYDHGAVEEAKRLIESIPMISLREMCGVMGKRLQNNSKEELCRTKTETN